MAVWLFGVCAASMSTESIAPSFRRATSSCGTVPSTYVDACACRAGAEARRLVLLWRQRGRVPLSKLGEAEAPSSPPRATDRHILRRAGRHDLVFAHESGARLAEQTLCAWRDRNGGEGVLRLACARARPARWHLAGRHAGGDWQGTALCRPAAPEGQASHRLHPERHHSQRPPADPPRGDAPKDLAPRRCQKQLRQTATAATAPV